VATHIQNTDVIFSKNKEMSHNKVVMKKYTVYLILDFVQLVTREAIPTPLKEVLLNGIYSLLDICTDYEYPSSKKNRRQQRESCYFL
jgi:hypothetical protein